MALDFIKGDDLVSAVAVAIRKRVPPHELTNIYKNKPRQDFSYCSLYIDVINSEQQREMRKRAQRTVFLDLRLHPKRDQGDAQSWCRDMTEVILDAVDEIPFKNSLLRVWESNTYYLEKEQVMHIFIVYRMKVLRVVTGVKPDNFMEELEHHEKVTYGKE